MTTDTEFFDCFLAAVRMKTPEIFGTGFHNAFIGSLKVVRKEYPNFGDFDVEYDPLYGRSAWLSKQMAYALRDLKISRNFLASRTEIQISKPETDVILSQIDPETRKKFEFLAEEFLRIMAKNH